MADNQRDLFPAKKTAMAIISGEKSPDADLIRNIISILAKFPQDADAQALSIRLDNMFPRKQEEPTGAKSFFRRLFKRS
jgi:hypothetical protein